jgi:hypothetical protein
MNFHRTYGVKLQRHLYLVIAFNIESCLRETVLYVSFPFFFLFFFFVIKRHCYKKDNVLHHSVLHDSVLLGRVLYDSYIYSFLIYLLEVVMKGLNAMVQTQRL